MKVKELIEQLKELDQEKEVLFLNNGDNPVDEGGFSIKEAFEIKGSLSNDYVYLWED